MFVIFFYFQFQGDHRRIRMYRIVAMISLGIFVLGVLFSHRTPGRNVYNNPDNSSTAVNFVYAAYYFFRFYHVICINSLYLTIKEEQFPSKATKPVLERGFAVHLSPYIVTIQTQPDQPPAYDASSACP